MLKKIICDKFAYNPVITFSDGLNVIAGDSVASNSIGKTTVLMIIDFVFGGDDYVKKNSDVIDNVGDHAINYVFEFSNKSYYFSRSTSNIFVVLQCDENFNQISSLNKKDYLLLLKRLYKCDDIDLTFRDIQGRYLRVYGKQNVDEKKPLHYVSGEPPEKAIRVLLKLFRKFKPIEDLENEIKSLKDEKQLLTKAAKRKIIPKIGIRDYKTNLDKINELQKNLDELKTGISNNLINLESRITDDMVRLYRKRHMLLSTKQRLETQLARLRETPTRRIGDITYELNKLKEFLPTFDTKRLNEIQKFHESLSDALRDELKQFVDESEKKLSAVCASISEIDSQITGFTDIEKKGKDVLDKIIDIAFEIKKYKSENEYYDIQNSVENNLASTENKLGMLKPNILSDVSNVINNSMEQLTLQIFQSGHKPPKIELGDLSYSFGTEEDRGTGTAFVNLISFDLSILQLTELPCLIHDLPLLKNIENVALGAIIKLYSEYYKQIFISLDKIDSYDDNTVGIINKTTVLRLSAEKVLFGKKWNR
ncbi:MAG: DUF2326 domain-containing protein [Parabacteroides sp.]|nr:DUF2326 domain-containing protein [Parabacteroides sp.]